ncbi:unnamed protein product [Vitrella brassicaformis CCMP3155]|uniref:Uncharacterized protein n=1 Tax=Vitrella brassicaformis (strain CCMP3155) TaxID=1169540 RepID=A0A0G4ES54_VITBC|nr:unnamed protein product [Vitrella brassicaformis CCMP3155]|mmetsp:Transcript_21652/g.61612  ORF Transcript_21652/g.61612 Transcript_21652/m.61612 type:complete len:245 (-) Transcript_21652:776-1510(-)|eukprot:CEM00690.1 unnamed protein product [Vitrella brassicaformis CCMP3155]
MVDDDGFTPLHYSAQNGREELVKEIVEHGGIDLVEKRTKIQSEPTPLHLAAKKGHVSVVNLLLDLGYSDRLLTIQDKFGRTIASVAAEEGQLEVLNSIANRKDINFILSIESNGRTIFHDAAFGGHVNVLQQLVEWSGNPSPLERGNKHGLTPLHMAASGNRVEAIEYMLAARGVKLLQKTSNDANSAMHLACLKGHREAVMCMVNKEGSRGLLKRTNNYGKTLIDLAEWKRHDELVKELKSMA